MRLLCARATALDPSFYYYYYYYYYYLWLYIQSWPAMSWCHSAVTQASQQRVHNPCLSASSSSGLSEFRNPPSPAGTTMGQDLNLATDRVLASRNFANKLWNAGKFILANLAALPQQACSALGHRIGNVDAIV